MVILVKTFFCEDDYQRVFMKGRSRMKILVRTLMDAHERWVNVKWMMGGRWMDDEWTLSRNSRTLEKLGTVKRR